MTRRDSIHDDFLDALLAEERQALAKDAPEISPELMARVLTDAQEVQAGFAPTVPGIFGQRQPRGVWAQLGAALGGWPAVAGLAAASVCGLWLGINPPDGLSDLAALYLTDEAAVLDPLSGFDMALGEG